MKNGLDLLRSFLKDLDVCLSELRESLPSIIEEARSGCVKQNVRMPSASLNDDGMTIVLASNMVSFCATPHRLEAVVIYYAIRSFAVDARFCEEEDADHVCEALLDTLDDETNWLQQLLLRLLGRKNLAFEYSTRFLQGRYLARTYQSLID